MHFSSTKIPSTEKHTQPSTKPSSTKPPSTKSSSSSKPLSMKHTSAPSTKKSIPSSTEKTKPKTAAADATVTPTIEKTVPPISVTHEQIGAQLSPLVEMTELPDIILQQDFSATECVGGQPCLTPKEHSPSWQPTVEEPADPYVPALIDLMQRIIDEFNRRQAEKNKSSIPKEVTPPQRSISPRHSTPRESPSRSRPQKRAHSSEPPHRSRSRMLSASLTRIPSLRSSPRPRSPVRDPTIVPSTASVSDWQEDPF
ncbi:uncharacterized protein [Ambystoma mexicanum]|uniref:uncharacterized protein n=1 Tax=Ambystoma mexicanum TaxID=8296 RepID=UPI0037E7F9DE